MPVQTQIAHQAAPQIQKQLTPLYVPMSTMRRSPARVTRVLSDLLVFVEVEHEARPLGLVFKPDKIEDYRGEPLAALKITVGADIPEIEWDEATFLVERVVLRYRGATPPVAASR